MIYKADEYENLLHRIPYTYSVSKLRGYEWSSGESWSFNTSSTIWDIAMSFSGEYLIVGDAKAEGAEVLEYMKMASFFI